MLSWRIINLTLKVCLQYLTDVLNTAEMAMLASPSPIQSIDFAPRSCLHQERGYSRVALGPSGSHYLLDGLYFVSHLIILKYQEFALSD